MRTSVRRGLPRAPGGDPWPPAIVAALPVAAVEHGGAGVEHHGAATGSVALRRGLPRVPGGQPWPPAGRAPAAAARSSRLLEREPEPVPVPAAVAMHSPAAVPGQSTVPMQVTRPAGASVTSRRARRLLGAVALVALLGGLAVVGARALVTVDAVADFVAAHPGAVPPPDGAPVGIPTWLSWQHFFNLFLIALILRTGLEVRRQPRPEAYWARRSDPRARINLIAWTHQALDVLWVLNGVAYVVLLFATGQWMRIVPLSWEVIPNAASTALQYLALDWPVEDGWAYYNALQQLSYVVTIFIAAPLAVASGVRMSIFWRAGGPLDRLYPAAVARRIHVPVMLYFVLFVVSHVGLVLATGARRNLNHMFAGTTGEGWAGTLVAVAALVMVAGAVVAVRPLLVAPVARRFGVVSGR